MLDWKWRYRVRFRPDLIGHPVVRFYTESKLEAGFGAARRGGAARRLLLDLGCGTWPYQELLGLYSENVLGVDPSRTMLEICTRSREGTGARHPVVQGEAERLPLAAGSVDRAFCMDTLHHLGDLEKAVEEVWRVLKVGGEFVAIEINPLNPLALAYNMIFKEERGVRRVTPSRVTALLEERFGRATCTYVQYLPFFLCLVPPALLPLLRAWEGWLVARQAVPWAASYFVARSRKEANPS